MNVNLKNVNEEAVKTKIEFTIRQMMSFGSIVEKCFNQETAEEIMNTLLKESCAIILSTMETDSVQGVIDPGLVEKLYTEFGNELNDLFDYLREFQGYPITIAFGKVNLGIAETKDKIYDNLLKLIQ